MTRINLVNVESLNTKHLIAELREIKRIPNCIKKGRFKLRCVKEFVLGEGHVSFFYDKIKFLHKRYLMLYREALKRGFKVQDFSSAFVGVPDYLYNDWAPKDEDIELSLKRIKERE